MIRRRLAIPLLAALGASPLACRHGTDLATLDARTLRPETRGDAGAPGSMRGTYFPPRSPYVGRHGVPVVVVEPILFRRELLYAAPDGTASGGLIPYLQEEGFPVWLVWSDPGSGAGARALSGAIARTVGAIARETGADRFDLVGLSLGAEGALRALEPLTDASSPVRIRRAAFLGGGFDFAYPHSFGARIGALRGGPAAPLCTLDGDAACAREFRTPLAVTPWLGSLPGGDPDALAPSRERFPFVAGLSLPVLFIGGKVDGISPSESVFPLYTLWGSAAPAPGTVRKRFFLAGRENALGWEFDHFDLFAGAHAADVWAQLASWLEGDD